MAADEMVATRQRHLDWYLALAEQAEPQLRGPEQTSWLERLELEHDNLRVALEFALAAEVTQAGQRLAGALWRLWDIHNHLSEGRRWLEAMLSVCAQAPTAVWAKVAVSAGALTYRQGDYLHAANLFEQSLAVYRKLDSLTGIDRCLNLLGLVAREQGDYARARVLHAEGLALCRNRGDTRGIARSLNSLGNVALEQGDYDRAALLYEESLPLWRGLADKWSIAGLLTNLGEVAKHQGDCARATALYRESLVLRQSLADKRGIANCFEGLATVATITGHAAQAARLFGAAEALRAAIGAPLLPADRADYDQITTRVRADLGVAEAAAAWQDGQALQLELAVAFALQQPPWESDAAPLSEYSPSRDHDGVPGAAIPDAVVGR